MAALNIAHSHGAAFSADSEHLIASTDAGLLEYPLRFSINRPVSRDGPEGESPVPLAPVGDEMRATMALSLNRRTVVTVHHDEVRIVTLRPGTNSTTRSVRVDNHYRWLALQPDGTWMAAMLMGSDTVHLWNLVQAAGSHELTKSPTPIRGSEYFVFSPDGRWFGTCSADQFQFYRVGAWDKAAFSIPRAPASIQHAPIAFNSDGNIVALAASRHMIHLVKLVEQNNQITTKLIAALESPDRSALEMLAFSPDGSRLAAGTMNLTIQLWNLASLRKGLAELNLASDWPTYR